MKKFISKALSSTAKSAANVTSMFLFYQPKAPKKI
ncbi:MAG: cyclic lactone autoinducer peptide [Bacillota bacterium]|nr:cyclic lactone autoinducer peptide [Bacillota bacterium]